MAERAPYTILAALFVANAGLIGANILLELAGLDAPFVDLDGEWNLAAWFSSLLLAAVAQFGALSSALSSGLIRIGLGALAVLFAFLSLDEVALVHERLVMQVFGRGPTAEPWYWPVLFVPLAPLLLAGIIALTAEHKRRVGSVLHPVAGFALLLLSQLIDAVVPHRDVPHTVLTPDKLVEESFELFGATLLIFSLTRILATRLSVERKPIPPAG